MTMHALCMMVQFFIFLHFLLFIMLHGNEALIVDNDGIVGKYNSPTSYICPRRCQCSSQATTIKCKEIIIDDIYNIPSTATSVHIHSSSLPFITPSAFAHLQNLKTLRIEESEVHSYHHLTFSYLNKIEHISLAYNQLKVFEIHTFTNLAKLSHLNISHNVIEDVKYSNTIHHNGTSLDTLKLLDLSYNKLIKYPRSLQSFRGLLYLNISHNAIKGGGINKPDTFPVPTNLVRLDIQDNYLEEAPILHLHQLKYLNISNNQLSSLRDDAFNQLTVIEELYIQDNPLHSLSHSLRPLTHLRKLDVSSMRNLVIKNDTFVGLQNLQSLNLSSSLIKSNLNLSNSSNIFQSLMRVESLDLSRNSLVTLHRNLLQNLPKLRYLYLQSSAWHCNCTSLSWINSLFVTSITFNSFYCNTPMDFYNVNALRVYREALSCDESDVSHQISITKVSNSVILQCLPNLFHESTVQWLFLPHGTKYTMVKLNVSDYSHDEIEHFSNRSKVPILDILEGKNGIYMSNLNHDERVQVLSSGDLYIVYTLRSDAGMYQCTKFSSVINKTATVFLRLDYEVLVEVKTIGCLFGFCCAFLVLLLSMFLTCVTDRSMRRCKRNDEEKITKAQQLKQMLIALDAYHQEQIFRLRTHYAGQLHKLRDNCSMQTTKISDNYAQQLDKVRSYKEDKLDSLRHYRDVKRDAWRDYKDSWKDYKDAKIGAWKDYKDSWRDYKDAKIDSLRDTRDNYSNQATRLRESVTHQYIRAHESYQQQILRLREYCAQQLKKVAKTYKLKQKHVSTIIDNLHIMEGCRSTNAQRTDSMLFEPNFNTLLYKFPPGFGILNQEIDDDSMYGSQAEYSKKGDDCSDSPPATVNLVYTEADMATNHQSTCTTKSSAGSNDTEYETGFHDCHSSAQETDSDRDFVSAYSGEDVGNNSEDASNV